MKSIFLLFAILPLTAFSQKQYADTTWSIDIPLPHYVSGAGPVVFIDEGHHNFHTKEGRYSPFAKVLELDGFNVKPFNDSISLPNLSESKILVIANALPASSLNKWEAPTESAFTSKEIDVIHDWVKKGGRLFLIADHMPMGGAAKNPAAKFGFTFYDSFSDNEKTESSAEVFYKANGSLSHNDMTKCRNGSLEVDSIATFTGQAFQIPMEAVSILNCLDGWVSLLPEVAWEFDKNSPKLVSGGWPQGAYMEYGKGRLVVFGEAAMFSAQIAEIDDYENIH